MWGQVLGMRPAYAVHRGFGEIVEGRQPVMRGVVVGGAVGDLDQQAARSFDQQRQREMRGDEVRVDGEPQQAQAVAEMVLPDRLVPLEQIFAAPDVVDEDVEPAMVAADPFDQRLHLLGLQMVGRDRDAMAAQRRHQLGGLLDRLRALVLGKAVARRAAGDIDGGAGGAELGGDAAAGSARGASDKRHFSRQRHGVLLRFDAHLGWCGVESLYINDCSFIKGSQHAPPQGHAGRDGAGSGAGADP